MALSLDGFKIKRAICEIRFEDAHLLFDRTGQILRDVKNVMAGLKVAEATPSRTTFHTDQGGFVVELGQSRTYTDHPDGSLEVFGSQCKQFFDIVTSCLEIKAFTRIGLRVLYRHEVETIEAAKKLLDSLRLINLGETLRYGVAKGPEEIILRWQNDQIGTMLRLKAEAGTVGVALPPELESEQAELKKSYKCLLVDVDRYTVAAVERSQWDPSSWIPVSMRTIKRETDDILER